METEVNWECRKGWPDQVQEHVLRSISAYYRNYKYIYVGISNDPERRLREHNSNDTYFWDRMIVKYESSSERNVNILEGYFVESPKTVNKYMGWSHMSPDSSTYYLYILLGNKKKHGF